MRAGTAGIIAGLKRAGTAAFLLACLLAGALAAAVPASPRALFGGSSTTTSTTTAPSPTTVTTTTTTTSTSTTTSSTTTPRPRTIQPGVRIAGVRVGGLTASAASAAVRRAFEAPLVLLVGRHRLEVAPGALGAVPYVLRAVARARSAPPGASIPLRVRVDRRRAAVYVARLAGKLDRAPVDSELSLRSLRPWLSKERPGRALRQRPAVRAIVAALLANSRRPIRLRQDAVPPRVTRATFGPVIVIRRASNRLQLYDGMRPWRVFAVATGQTTYPTPLGRFQIVVKWRNPWWYPPDSPWAEGQQPVPPGPDNPLGTRWMGLSAPGVGIHGTPSDGSIGYSVSHGCIRMHIPEAEWLFEHVSIGTPVYIVAA